MFTDWLNKEMIQRGWSMRELARRGSISHGSVANVLSGKTKPTADFCLGVARAFKIDHDYVLQKAGRISSIGNENNLTFQELVAHLSEMSIEEQREILRYVLFRKTNTLHNVDTTEISDVTT